MIDQSSNTVLVAGLGQVGMMHMSGALRAGWRVAVVSGRQQARDAALAAGCAMAVSRLEDVNEAVQAAILAGNADVRPAQFETLCRLGIRHILLEKPLCQSRQALTSMRALAGERSVQVNLVRRVLPRYLAMIQGASDRSPMTMNLNSGALGFGCNGIHWIDLAVMLAGRRGELRWGRIAPDPIASHRGPRYHDHGGDAVWEFPDGSILTMSMGAASAAPHILTIRTGHDMLVMDGLGNRSITYHREPGHDSPPNLYGEGYRSCIGYGEDIRIADLTCRWLNGLTGGAALPLPSLEEAAIAHEMLFDLLERTGNDSFAFP